MLSSLQPHGANDAPRHYLPLVSPQLVRSLADVGDSDTNDDRDAFLARLGLVLSMARKHAGLKQEEAAARLGMSPAAIGRWEAGANKISGYDLVRLIRLYDFDPDLAVNPPASRPAIRRRLGPIPDAARRAVHRGLLRPLPPVDGGPE
jgi:transcriptional regulator with XRE-family HTH domain